MSTARGGVAVAALKVRTITAVSHIPHFGDANTSPAGDAASPTQR
jgi:hypothetical protein